LQKGKLLENRNSHEINETLIALLQAVIQSKDVIVHIVGTRTGANQLKNFREMKGIISTNFNCPRDKDDYGIRIVRWLDIETFGFMLDRADRA
jgi:hypothetical protein